MNKIKKLRICKSKYPNNEGNYILFLYSETEHGYNIKRVFKGTKNACYERKMSLINESI